MHNFVRKKGGKKRFMHKMLKNFNKLFCNFFSNFDVRNVFKEDSQILVNVKMSWKNCTRKMRRYFFVIVALRIMSTPRFSETRILNLWIDYI